MTSAPRQLDCFTIALGKKTGTTFPIMLDNKHNYNTVYDTGAGASLINYSAYVSLGQDLDTGYQPFMKNASGEDMGALEKEVPQEKIWELWVGLPVLLLLMTNRLPNLS